MVGTAKIDCIHVVCSSAWWHQMSEAGNKLVRQSAIEVATASPESDKKYLQEYRQGCLDAGR